VSSGKGWARSVLGVKTGAPSGVVCVMWINGEEVERYFSRSVEIALRVWETFSVLRWPEMYLEVCVSSEKYEVVVERRADGGHTRFGRR
jgi:hypothetical protein